MANSANDELIGTWVTGWSGARGYDNRHDGRVHASLRHDTTGDWEYVVHEPTNEELVAIAETLIKHPNRRLVAFTDNTSELVKAARTAGMSVVAQDEVIMSTAMAGHDVEDPRPAEGFEWQIERDGQHAWVSLHPENDHDVVAASGHVSVVGDVAVFDRIITDPDYRRRGFASLVMRALAAIALEGEVVDGLLVATQDGQELYKYLGWKTLGSAIVFEGGEPHILNSPTAHS